MYDGLILGVERTFFKYPISGRIPNSILGLASYPAYVSLMPDILYNILFGRISGIRANKKFRMNSWTLGSKDKTS